MTHWSISVEEFTERYSPPTVWPFSTAITISVVIHSAVLAGLIVWLNQDYSFDQNPYSPVFEVSLSQSNSDQDAGADQVPVLDNLNPKQAELSHALVDAPVDELKENSATLARESFVAVAESAPESLEQIPSPKTAQIQADTRIVVENPSWQIAQVDPELDVDQTPIERPEPAPETRPVSDAQRKMLEQYQKEWQEALSQLDNDTSELSWQQGQQIFSASIRQQAPQNNTDLERAIVEVSTEVDGVKMTTQMGFKRLAFSHYAQLVDRWDRNVALSEDEIYGRFHSNSRIVVAPERRKEPKFNGKVTVASSVTLRGLSQRSEVFLGGLETRVKRILLPKSLALSGAGEEVAEPLIENYIFEEDGQIELLEQGGFNWTSELGTSYYDCFSPCYIKAADDVTVGVEGVVNGTIVISAEEKIQITGNVVYRQDPEQLIATNQQELNFDENAQNIEQDYLGLLSENYIEIASPSVTGSGDLTIHGALYAKRRFVVRHFRNRNRGLLSIFGSLTAGSLSASEPRYATRIDFDPRFEQLRLPNFPMTNKYELENWDKQWIIVE